MSPKNKKLAWAAFHGIGTLMEAGATGWFACQYNEGEDELWKPLFWGAATLSGLCFTMNYLYGAGKEAAKEDAVAPVIGDGTPPADEIV